MKKANDSDVMLRQIIWGELCVPLVINLCRSNNEWPIFQIKNAQKSFQ